MKKMRRRTHGQLEVAKIYAMEVRKLSFKVVHFVTTNFFRNSRRLPSIATEAVGT